jgi:outer membrane protein assembly factor BamB
MSRSHSTRRDFLRYGASALALGAAPGVLAADWGQFRGPARDGISKEKGLLQEWPAGGPKLVWKNESVLFGFGAPAVAEGRVFLVSNEGPNNEFVQALDAKDGSRIWACGLGKVGNPQQQPSYPGSRTTPTVDGNLLYAMGSDGDLVCVETATGKIRWKRSMKETFGARLGTWAISESPLIEGDKVIVTPGGPEATVVALNKTNGELVWKTAAPEQDEAAYSSAILHEIGGVKQIVHFLGKGVAGLDVKTGQILWRYPRTALKSPANIPTPVVRGEYVYTASGLGGAGLVKVKAEGGKFTPEEVYFATRLPNAIGGCVLVGDYMYGTGGAGLMCVEFMTGTIKWTERGVGPGSILFADGRLYIHGEGGATALVEPSPEGYKEKGRIEASDVPGRGTNKAWAYPAIANGRLYIRELGLLWCYDISSK